MRRLLAFLVIVGCGDDGATGSDAQVDAPAVTTCTPALGWSMAPALTRGPTQETAAVAVDGKIYVFGGFDDQGAVLSVVQIFDTQSCTWSAGPELPRAVHHANAAVVGDRIFIVGAMETINFTAVGHVWSWAPATETTWTAHAAMPAGTQRGSALAGTIGSTIYLAGGLRNGAVTQVSALDTSTMVWDTTLPALPQARDHGCGGVVGGKLYLTGGRGGAINSTSASVFEYTPGGAWIEKAPMPTARGGTACGVIGDQILVVGGEGNTAVASGVFPNVESYRAADDTWSVLPPMTVPRHGLGAAAWNGSLYVPGGATRQGFGAVATHDIFTP